MNILEYDLPGTSVAFSITDAGGSTSNMILPKLGHAVLPAFLALELLTGGTSSPIPQPPPAVSAFVRTQPNRSLDKSAALEEAREAFLPALAKSVRSLRRRSGLTWDELAYIFGVSRRTLHNWSTGGQVSASHARAIASVITLVHSVDSGDPRLTRSRLLAPTEDGATAYSRLANQHRTAMAHGVPSYRPDELLAALHDSPDPTGEVVTYERLT